MPGQRHRLPGEARSGLGSPRAGRSRRGEGEARPGRARRDPPGRGAGAGPAGAGPGRGRGCTGGGRSGGPGAGVPPHLRASRGVSRPEMHGRRAQLLDLGPPRGALARRHSHPCDSRGASRQDPPSSRCQSAPKLRSHRFPAGIAHPVGTRRCFLQAWAGTPATTASPRMGPLGAPRPPGQRPQPGLEPRPRPGCLGSASPPSPQGGRLIPALHFPPLP